MDKMEENELIMVFGDENTLFREFYDLSPEEIDFLNKNNDRVNLSYFGFAEEWSDWVDFDTSYAYIDNNKLYVVVNGLPEHINVKAVKKDFGETLEQYIKQGYGEFFETESGCPVCVVVERDGKRVIV